MQILYFANPKSIHTQRWVDYFRKRNIVRIHPNGFCTKPNIIHAHYAGWNGLKGAWYASRRKIPFVLTVWGSDVIINQKNWLKRFFLKYQIKKASLITTDALHMERALIHLGAIPHKIERINFGVDTEVFKPLTVYNKHRQPTIISLRNNDQETLTKAIQIIKKKFPTLTCLCVNYNIHPLDQDKVKRELQFSWVYIDTSPTDGGLAQSTAEAMACGLPVIVTDFGDNTEWVGSTQVFPVGEHIMLAGMVINLLKSKERCEFTGRANRDAIVVYNNYRVEMSKMEKLYEHLLQEFKSR